MLLGVSDYSALGEVSRLLRERLRTAFLAEPHFRLSRRRPVAP